MSQWKYNLYFVMIAFVGMLVVVVVFQLVLQGAPKAAQPPDAADVVVVGGDTAAVISALTAAQSGAQVVLLPQEQEIGFDCSFLVSSGLAAADTPTQREMDIELSRAQLRELIMHRGGEMSTPSLLNSFIGASEDVYNTAQNYGLTFDYLPEPQAMPYWHASSQPHAISEMVETILQELRYTPVTVRDETVKEIIVNDGEVSGVWLENEKGANYPLYSRAVILAGGGYSAAVPSWHHYISPENLIDLRPLQKGEGLHLAEKAGADFVQMGFLNKQLLIYDPENNNSTSLPVHSFEKVLLVNSAGSSLVLEESERNEALDAANFTLRSAPSETFVVISEEEMEKEEEDRDQEISDKVNSFFHASESLESVAEKYDLESIPHIESNSALEPPYLASQVKAGIDYTLGGISVTSQGEVLKNRQVLEGLYACGEAIGGLHGQAMVEGMPLSETFITSQIAGKAAADYAGR